MFFSKNLWVPQGAETLFEPTKRLCPRCKVVNVDFIEADAPEGRPEEVSTVGF